MPWRSMAFDTRFARGREHAVHARGEGRRLPGGMSCVPVADRRLPYRRRTVTSVFYLFRDATQRRAALELETGSSARYAVTDWTSSSRADTSYATTSSGRVPRARPRAAGCGVEWALQAAGGYGGDFATVLSSLGLLNRSDVVLSTVDTVGIPLMLLARAHVVRSPFVYVAIGLPELLVRLGSRRMEGIYARALERRRRSSLTASTRRTSVGAAARSRRGRRGRVRAVRCGRGGVPADRSRRRLSTWSRSARTRTVTTAAARARSHDAGDELPGRHDCRVRACARRPPGERRDRDRRAVRRDARPARAGTRRRTAGAREQLLRRDDGPPPGDGAREARRRDADGRDRCRLWARRRREPAVAAPGDTAGFGRSLADLLRDEGGVRALGLRARATVEARLDWERYVGRLSCLVDGAAHGRDDTPGR